MLPEEVLQEVFLFLLRDYLDALQLVCRLFNRTVRPGDTRGALRNISSLVFNATDDEDHHVTFHFTREAIAAVDGNASISDQEEHECDDVQELVSWLRNGIVRQLR